MMMSSDCGGTIVFQGCNSMQKIFENIGKVDTGMQISICLVTWYKIVIIRPESDFFVKVAIEY